MTYLLPIGSVVSLNGSPQKFMIYGRLQKTPEGEHVFDYCACPYPAGHMTSEQNIVFDQENINTLYFVGFQDGEELAFRQTIAQQYDELKPKSPPVASRENEGGKSSIPAQGNAPCPSCGQLLAPDLKFCPNCGASQVNEVI